jgi:hypothetical protein
MRTDRHRRHREGEASRAIGIRRGCAEQHRVGVVRGSLLGVALMRPSART